MKNYALDRKMIGTSFNDLDVLYHHAEFGEIELRAPDVGAKMWCLYVFCLFVTLRVRRAVRSSAI